MRKSFYWAFAFSLCVLMGCKDDGVRVEVSAVCYQRTGIHVDLRVSEFSEGDG